MVVCWFRFLFVFGGRGEGGGGVFFSEQIWRRVSCFGLNLNFAG